MATVTYTDLWEMFKHLPIDEQRRLSDDMVTHLAGQSEDERFLAQFDALGAQISAAWKGDLDAAETIAEGRRDL